MYETSTSTLDFEQLISHLPTDMVVLDTALKYIFISPVSVKDETLRSWIIGKTDEEFCAHRNLEPAIAHRRTHYLQQALEQRKPIPFIEEITKEGNTRYFQRIYVPVLEDDGYKVKHILGYGLDITEQRKVELANQHLVQQILDRESHKVNGSLARIKGLFELLKMEHSAEGIALYKHLIDQQIDEMAENVKEVTHILYSGLSKQQ